ncbi:MAG TPA: ribosome-binding factor A [Candidatus Babeliales bacterium]|jgi:ribosome-binding factor A|nr:ribosome-binding factor A [Candidatus Babeliales bacterium]
MSKQQQEIRKAQKESYFYQEISKLFLQITIDDPRLNGLFINRVHLSPDGGTCVVLFLASHGRTEFEEKLSTLVLYKPSMRTALAKTSRGRYTPNLIFRYDEDYEKVEKINRLLDTLKEEGKL